MSNTDTIVILIAFAAYLVLMIAIGAIYMKNTNNSEDYFLGGRGLSGCIGNRAVLDRDRTVSRNSLQLGVYFFTIEKIYDQGK